MGTAATGLRCTRAAILATAATLLALWAHLNGGGSVPSAPVLGFLVLTLTALLAPFFSRPASATRIVLLTAGGQFLAHTTLALSAATDRVTPATSAPSPGPPTAAHHATAATGGGTISQLSDHLLASDPRMLVAHVAAAVVVGAWLAAGERTVWSLVALIWRAVFVPVLAAAPPTARSMPGTLSAVTSILMRMVVGCVVRRGPPHLLAV